MSTFGSNDVKNYELGRKEKIRKQKRPRERWRAGRHTESKGLEDPYMYGN